MNYKKTVIWTLLAAFVFLAAGCAGSKKSQVQDDGKSLTQPVGKIVYLANNIHVQEQKSRRGESVYRASYANYINPGAGHMIIPVNTQVEMLESGSIRGKELLITDLQDGKKIHLEVNLRNINMSFDEYILLISSPTPIALNHLSGTDKKGIQDGKAYEGMSKEGVRIALGYPAPHKTPSLDADEWTYWQNRFHTMVIEFDNGKVKSIR